MILLTGATGFVGRHLVKKLVEKKYKLRCLIRSENIPETLSGLKIDFVKGDLQDKKSLVRATKGISELIHLAAIIGDYEKADKELLHRVNVLGSQNLIDTCLQNGVKRIIMMSSLAAKSSHPREYGKTKLEAEKRFMASGLDVTIFRPGLIYGSGSRALKFIEEKMRRMPLFPIIGDGNYGTNPVHVDDISDVIIKALETKKSAGKIYELSSGYVSFNKLVGAIEYRSGLNIRKIHIPERLCLFFALLMEIIPGSYISREKIKNLVEDVKADTGPAKKDLGFKSIEFETGMKKLHGDFNIK